MRIGNIEVSSPVALAPMAGVTGPAFRKVCAAVSGCFTVTEMISAKALCYGDQKTAALMEAFPGENPLCVQLFGSEPEVFARAAALIEDRADIIDINMGCPTPKIVNNGEGCALMRDPKLAAAIVEAVVKSCRRPVTVKFRKGWDSGSVNASEFAKALEQAGASALCVHGRTKTQMYSGRADWDIIAKVRKAVCIPVTANGDIFSPESALLCRQVTGAGMFMVGRAAFGDPWLLLRISQALRAEPVSRPPTLAQRLAVAREQFSDEARRKGERPACLEARRHLGWYIKGLPGAAKLRGEVTSVNSLSDIDRIIKTVLDYSR